MFGSTNPFGQSSNSPFGSTSGGFGQPNNGASNNPFAPKPFGSTSPSPFGGSQQPSMFGSTSTGVFGAPSSQPAFGASSSSPTFGTPAPAFGASSTPAFGSTAFGQQKPAFGGFGSSTPQQPSPFGSTFQQQPQQPAFGSNPFGASNQPAFGAASTTTPAFGSTSTTPAFGAVASTPAFGATTTTPAFGSNTGSAFGTSTTPSIFGSGGGGGGFGASTTPAFGASTTTPAFGASSSAPSFSFASSPAFGQSTSAFGTTTFGASTSPFGAQTSAFGAQPAATTPSFGSTGFGQSGFGSGQRGGSRVAAYSATPEVDGSTSQPAGKLESISAMPVYKDKCHEELRWEDYQLGDKGGPSPAGQPAGGATAFGAATQPNPFATSSTFGQSSANPFSSTMAANPFAPKPSTGFGVSGFGSSTTTAAFGSSPFGSTSSAAAATTSIFGNVSAAPTFASSPSLFGSTSSPAFGTTTPSVFGSASASGGTTSAFGTTGLNFGNTQSSPLFQSTTPSLGQTTPAFGQTSGSLFGQSTPSAFGQSSNLFTTPSTGFGGNIFSSTPSLQSAGMGFGQTTSAQPAQTAGSFGFGSFGQSQPAGLGAFGGMTSNFGQSTFGQLPAIQSPAVAQPVAVTNPFGTLPAMPQMSITRSGTAPSVQYGISSLPVVDRPAPVRVSSLLTSRHFSQRRIRLPARKYHPKDDAPKVPFFTDDEETSSTPKADALFIPRENPRALIIRPLEQWPPRTTSEKTSPLKDTSTSNYENGKGSGEVHSQSNGFKAANKEKEVVENGNHKSNGVENGGVSGQNRAGEAAAIVYEHGAGIESLMPKLRHSDYYTEPRIQELAAKERAEPGFCRHVKDFVVGRHGFGSIKFVGGETDVRGLDIESIVQFNNREIIVYMDETKKPPVGQGLNKPAEVTLLNIKCFDKKTGRQYTEGPKLDRYIDMLKRKAEDQGAKFVSYDPIKGEWKFMVSHFSTYKLGSEDDDDEEEDHCCVVPAAL